MKSVRMIMGIMLGFGISVLPMWMMAEDPYVPLYTNVVVGGTLTLTHSLSVNSSGASDTNEAVIVFEGDGTLNGGGIILNNIATGTNSGSYDIVAIVVFGTKGHIFYVLL